MCKESCGLGRLLRGKLASDGVFHVRTYNTLTLHSIEPSNVFGESTHFRHTHPEWVPKGADVDVAAIRKMK